MVIMRASKATMAYSGNNSAEHNKNHDMVPIQCIGTLFRLSFRRRGIAMLTCLAKMMVLG